MSTKYDVFIEPFAKRYYIKIFAKKYKKAWDFTLNVLTEEFKKFDILLLKTIAEEITDKNKDIVICKTEFKISGTEESRHTSGNRCIVARHTKLNKINVLLIYHKNDLGMGNETTNWKKIIKENYSEYKHLL